MEATQKKELKELKMAALCSGKKHRQRLLFFTINLTKQDFFTIKTMHTYKFNINKH